MPQLCIFLWSDKIYFLIPLIIPAGKKVKNLIIRGNTVYLFLFQIDILDQGSIPGLILAPLASDDLIRDQLRDRDRVLFKTFCFHDFGNGFFKLSVIN